jgi:glycosyltransferase involved in cell wall biosynthesis
MRVLHVTPAYYPATYFGGPIFSVYGLCNALAQEAGVEVRVLTTDAAGPHVQDRVEDEVRPVRYAAGYDVFRTSRIAGVSVSPGLLWRLPAQVRWADVVHLTGMYSFTTIPTVLTSRVFRKPLVLSPRGSLQATWEWAGARRRALKRIWAFACNAMLARDQCVLHVTSEAERLASTAQVPKADAVIVRNGVEIPMDLPSRSSAEGRSVRLLFIGRLDPKKGLETLLVALAQLDDRSLALEVCGTGDASYVKQLEDLVRSLRLVDRVCFSGHVGGEEKRDAFLRADICVVPSHSENFGNVVAEALAHGVPVIASRGTPWHGLTLEGCGLWVENTPGAIADAINRVRWMDMRAMGARGRAWMQREFGWRAVAQEMVEVYRRVAAARG